MIDKKEYQQLIDRLCQLSYQYHTLDKPTVSDDFYDQLVEKIKAFERKFPDQISQRSPTQRVGGKLKSGFSKVKHYQPMLSLPDFKDEQEVADWAKRCSLGLDLSIDKLHYFVDIKMDGLALSVIYENGQFARALTRGNGQVGEDVSHNARTIKNIPLSLAGLKKQPQRLEVRGEVVIYQSDFLRLNQERIKANQPTYANSRNLAAGSMRQIDPAIASRRPLAFRAYDLICDELPLADVGSVFDFFRRHNISHNSQARVCQNLDEVISFVNHWRLARTKLNFASDGIVIRLNDRKQFSQLGATAHSPRGAIAFKYKPKTAKTKLRQIKFQIGRTGIVTPVAIFDPVIIDGTKVSQASLHNIEELIYRLKIKTGDQILVYKAGDIIPKVAAVKVRDGPVFSQSDLMAELAKQYPGIEFVACRQNNTLVYKVNQQKSKSGSVVNILLKLAVEHYCSRPAVDIVGLATETVGKLIDEGLVTNLADIYRLDYDNLIALDGFGKKSVDNLLANIQARRQPSLARFIFGLGIPQVGRTISSDLADFCRSVESFRQVRFDHLQAVDGVGPVVAQSVIDWLSDQSNQKLLDDFARYGVEPLESTPIKPNQDLGRFVLTGKLDNFSRAEVVEIIKKSGGRVSQSISSQTDGLIVGQRASPTKIDKATEIGVPIIVESMLFEVFLKP